MEDQILLDLLESLKPETEAGFAASRLNEEEIKNTLQRIEAQLDRQGGIINGGARSVTRIIGWAGKTDQLLARWEQDHQDLKRRMEKLEKND